LDVPDESVVAWNPGVPGVAEVLRARFVRHAYPAHTHDTWTLLIVDDGAIRYDLDRCEFGAVEAGVTLLPPNVAHTGRASTSHGFRKRVIYLDASVLEGTALAAAVSAPYFADRLLRQRVSQLHDALRSRGRELDAESRLALVATRLRARLGSPGEDNLGRRSERRLAAELRDMLDDRLATGLTLSEAGSVLGARADQLVRAFAKEFGLPPHRYLIARRIDVARRRLLAGHLAADVAQAVGFYDQAHLTRHFTRQLGVSPARYARGSASLPPLHGPAGNR
jgi:AraC-like DNA-binding protein